MEAHSHLHAQHPSLLPRSHFQHDRILWSGPSKFPIFRRTPRGDEYTDNGAAGAEKPNEPLEEGGAGAVVHAVITVLFCCLPHAEGGADTQCASLLAQVSSLRLQSPTSPRQALRLRALPRPRRATVVLSTPGYSPPPPSSTLGASNLRDSSYKHWMDNKEDNELEYR